MNIVGKRLQESRLSHPMIDCNSNKQSMLLFETQLNRRTELWRSPH